MTSPGPACRFPVSLAILAIISAGIYAHGFLLLTDYRLWDGWEYALWLSDERQLPFIKRLFSEIGRPLDWIFWKPFAGLRNPHIVAKFAGVTAWITHAILMFECLRRTLALGPTAALAIALLSVTCPVFRPLGDLSIWMNTAAVMIFWFGIFLLVRIAECTSMPARVILRCGGLSLLFLAFNLNSQLVYFYGLVAAAWAWEYFRGGFGTANRSLKSFLWRYPDACILPVVFWTWKAIFTPSHGAYEAYNQPSLSPAILGNGYVALVTHFFIPFVTDVASRPGVLAGACVMIAFVAYFLRSRTTLDGIVLPHGVQRMVGAYLSVAGILMVAASFPYICVGQFLAEDAWLARNNILAPLSLSFFVVGLLIWISRLLFPQQPTLWFFGCIAVCVVWGASSSLAYARLQTFGVKQLAIQRKLQAVIAERSPAVIQIRDYLPLRGGIAYYPQLIWTAMAACCDQLPKTLVFDSRPFVSDHAVTTPSGEAILKIGSVDLTSNDVQLLIHQSTVEYALSEIQHTGRQFVMTIQRPFDTRTEERLGLDYLKQRWFGSDCGSSFIESFVESQLLELQPVRPVDPYDK
jgi:hypothetical protein